MSGVNRREALKAVSLASAGVVAVVPVVSTSQAQATGDDWRVTFDKAVAAVPEFRVDEPGDRAPNPAQPDKRRLTKRLEDLTAFQPNADVMWVGGLVHGDSIRSGVLRPITVAPKDRAPLVLTTNLPGPAPASAKVESPSLASVTEAVNQLVEGHIKTGRVQAARATYNYSRFSSLEESALRLGVSAEWMSGSMKSSFETQAKKSASTVLVRFVQSYFTVSCQPPETPSSVILNEAAVAAFGQLGRENPPAYISTQTWGRELWLCVSSNENIHKLEASIEASFKALTASGKVEMKYSKAKTFLESSINGYAFGGSFEAAQQILTGNPGELKAPALIKYVTDGRTMTKDSPPALLSYQLRYLGSRALARLSYSTDYILPSPRKATKVQVTYQTNDSDKDGKQQGSGGAQVIFTLRLDKTELGSVDIADEKFVRWPDFSPPKTFTLILSKPISEQELSRCDVQVRQEAVKAGGNPSWRFRFRVQAFFDGPDEGRPTTLLDFTDPLDMRQPDGQPYFNRMNTDQDYKCFDFDGATQATPWVPLLRP